MALPPKFAGQAIAAAGTPAAAAGGVHTVELFLDYVCPFSAKMFRTLSEGVFPGLAAAPYGPRVRFLVRQQIQPWHPSSTLTHEAAAAVLTAAPDKFQAFSGALFAHQQDYFDVSVVHEARNDTYRRLARLAEESVGVPESAILPLLLVSDKPGPDGALNIGNKVTNDIKLMVKMNRLQGVHVTPTVLFNGVVANDISSSFTAEQWQKWLQENIT